MKIVFLNGPPGCGKDTAAEHVGMRVNRLKFAAPIKRMVAGCLNETIEWLEANKDIPDDRLNNETPRKFLIRLSEELIKPIYGKQFFGRCMVEELRKIETEPGYRGINEYVLITDSGFWDEAVPVVNTFGIDNCLKIEIRRSGKTFEGDSRSYWKMTGLRTVSLFNDGRPDQLGDKLFGILSNVYGCHL